MLSALVMYNDFVLIGTPEMKANLQEKILRKPLKSLKQRTLNLSAVVINQERMIKKKVFGQQH